MTDLADIISLDEAAELFGRQPEAFRKAAQRGSLEAKRVTPRCWITTRQYAAAYVARVAAGRPVRRPPAGIRPPERRPWIIEVLRNGRWTTEGLGDENEFPTAAAARDTLGEMLMDEHSGWEDEDRFRVVVRPW